MSEPKATKDSSESDTPKQELKTAEAQKAATGSANPKANVEPEIIFNSERKPRN